MIDRSKFQKSIIFWYIEYGRYNFPWRKAKEPYLILISELLLRKTGAWKAEDVYRQIVSKYKGIESLSTANSTELKELIFPLGLHSRAELLIEISKDVMDRFNGEIPSNYDDLITIKGIGQYIANSILCFGYAKKMPIVDGRVKRVISRCIGYSSKKMPYADKELWTIASDYLPNENYIEYNYGILDIGGTLCKPFTPVCEDCPLKSICPSTPSHKQ